MECVKSAGSLQSVMVNPKCGVLIEEMEQMDDQAQKCIPVSQAVISIKAKSLYNDLKKRIGKTLQMRHHLQQVMAHLIGLRKGEICTISNLVLRLQVLTMMLRQVILHSWLS
jgi:hypothetical protein